MENQRVIFLDYLRVAACLMVILVHACEPFYLGGEGTYIANSNDAFWVTIFDSAVRCCVPLFVMTSSYLLFPVAGEVTSFYRRRFFRVVIPFIIWSILYAVVPLLGVEDMDIKTNLASLTLNFNMMSGHLWFVYMIVGIYIAMPIFSPWIERVSKRGEQIFIGAWALTTLVPFLRQAALAILGRAEVYGEANWNEFGALYYISGFIGYIVLAHYIRTYVDWSWRKTLAVSIPLWIVGYAISALWFWAHIPQEYPINESIDLAVLMEQSWRFCSIGVTMVTSSLFLIFKKINCSGWLYKVVKPISKVSYGIYLMHIFVLVAAVHFIRNTGIATPWVILSSTAVTFIICAVISYAVSKLPFGKYFVG